MTNEQIVNRIWGRAEIAGRIKLIHELRDQLWEEYLQLIKQVEERDRQTDQMVKDIAETLDIESEVNNDEILGNDKNETADNSKKP